MSAKSPLSWQLPCTNASHLSTLSSLIAQEAVLATTFALRNLALINVMKDKGPEKEVRTGITVPIPHKRKMRSWEG